MKRYIFYTIIYLAAVGAAAFSINNGEFALHIFGREINLPVAVWAVIPVAIFAVLSIFHIAYDGIKNYFENRAIRNDGALYNALAKEIFLGLESNKEFKTPLFNDAVWVTKTMSKWVDLGEPKFKDTELKNAYEIAKSVENGEFCDLRKFKLLKTNPLFIQNEINHIKSDYRYALGLFSNKTEMSESVKNAAREAIIKNGAFAEILKISPKFENSEIFELLERFKNDEISISPNELFSLILGGEFDAANYLKIAQILKTKLAPEQIIGIFDRLKNEQPDASEAHLYLLYDFGMISELRELLANSQNGEFEPIKTLMFLKDNGKMVNADIFYK